MLLDVVKLLHCHRSLGVGVYEVVWCLLSSFDTKSLAYTRLVGAYMVGIGVVKSLHWHRSLGVGLLRCWMLLVELETTWRRDRDDVTALFLQCCVLAANLTSTCLLTNWESRVWLIRGCMVLANLETKMTTKSRRCDCPAATLWCCVLAVNSSLNLLADDFGIDSLTNMLLVLANCTRLTGIEDDERYRS